MVGGAEVIVVDNASQPAVELPPELDNGMPLRCVRLDENSGAAARNADPPDADESTTDWVDLMFHLHGILTGGFPVVKIPHIRLPLREETKEEDDGY